MARLALATDRDHRDDPEITLLAAALREAGHDAQAVVWDDPEVDWSTYAMTVLRTVWDYTARYDDFLAWTRRVPRLRNRADVVAWNTTKTYLRDLAAHDCPVIPTLWDATDVDEVDAAADALGIDAGAFEWVVKPAVSAGSRDTARWPDTATAIAHSRELVAAGRSTMLQPYVASVDTQGETALLFVGGEFSHAVVKGAMLAPGEGVVNDRDSRERITATEPSAAQLDVARRALRAARKALGGGLDLLYARVDLVQDATGAQRVLELELTEPSLFLADVDGAPKRFAEAISASVRSLGRA